MKTKRCTKDKKERRFLIASGFEKLDREEGQ